LLQTSFSGLSPIQEKFARRVESVSCWEGKDNGQPIGLADVIKNCSATILIGVSSQPGQFTEPIVKDMASKVQRPIIFPLSNPSDHAEAIPEDLIRWTDGRAIVATGTEFPPVSFRGKTFNIAQCNNFYIFPAIGLAVATSGATRVTDRMIIAAAEALGNFGQKRYNANADDRVESEVSPLLPPIESMRDVAMHIALKVGLQAQQDGVAPEMSEGELHEQMQKRFWIPEYRNYRPSHRKMTKAT
jgi:malate dehydrogenase (oxaloacetate-decarboxylating)